VFYLAVIAPHIMPAAAGRVNHPGTPAGWFPPLPAFAVRQAHGPEQRRRAPSRPPSPALGGGQHLRRPAPV